MFAKELPGAFTRVRLYNLYSKSTDKWAHSVMINVYHVPKISLSQNAIVFHLPTHIQIVEYRNPNDAKTEYDAIYAVLNK